MFSTKFLTLYKYFKNLSTFGRNLSQICLHNEVRQALVDEQAVVALESTIITHGMKFDYNIKTAREVERIIREQGAVPATIAVLNGEIKVGLTEIELEELAQKQEDCYKISRRDFPYIISHKLTGGTTVSGTMIIAHKVGIPIFVTGGIGGVHREGETTMDISADLTELGRTPVAVFCSGVKSILDIGKTLEYLETQGVAVATYGPSKVFPEFFCRGTKFFSPCNLETDKAAAQFIETIFDMKLNSGLLIGVPIPDKYSLNERMISSAIEEGLQMAKKSDIRGKNVTPFLLSKVSEITEGKSLEASIL
ncbi:hypothetical protein RUM43_000905 [Polyplax serrata]|uniref:Pseudouridine-5'-phosphate glycosidase n=1 Tax=Polyplax serrata TaxID=468196 RepID=A0AAN8XT02_POLSC